MYVGPLGLNLAKPKASTGHIMVSVFEGAYSVKMYCMS